MAENERAARLLEVYKQLKDGATDVDYNLLFGAAERLVNAERDAETYRQTWGKSPFGSQTAALGTATGVEAVKGHAAGRTLPTLDELKSIMTPVRAANLAAEEIEAKQPERS